LNDELSPAIADKLTAWFGPSDPEGIPREYAAGSAYDDMRNTERRENQESADKFPVTYRAGQIAGGIPSSIAMSGMGAGLPTLAGRVAAGGLAAGARGGIEGAGLAEDGNKLEGAARAAGPSALLGMAGAAAPTAFKAVKDLFKGGPPSGPVPALATAGAGAQPSASEVARGAQAASAAGPTINRALGGSTPAPRPPPAQTVPPPPKGGRPKPSGPPSEEHIPQTRAIPPPSSEEALDASMSSGLPKQPEPIEFTRKYQVDWGPNHGEKLGPGHGDPGESRAPFRDRIRAQDDQMWQARGGEPPARTWSDRPRALTEKERIATRGQSMTDALDQENSPEQLAGLPKLDSEYAQAAKDAPALRSMQWKQIERETAAAKRKAALEKLAQQNQNFGELDLDASNSKSPTGEFKLDSKAATNLDSGAKKTDVKSLMKKRPDDSDD
jgi:hypothetical protein